MATQPTLSKKPATDVKEDVQEIPVLTYFIKERAELLMLMTWILEHYVLS